MNGGSAVTLGSSASKELKDLFAALQPYTEKTVGGQKLRQEGFRAADKNASGQCSLAELESFIQYALQKAYNVDRSETLFKCFRLSYARAYARAKALDRSGNNDYINFAEFRVFNAYVCIFASMLDCFQKVDVGKDERDDNPDRRISLVEFTKRFEKTKGYGFVALEGIRTADEAKAVFDVMDANAGGFVLFNEWCDYISKAEVRMRTEMGELLEGKLQLQVHDDKTVISAISFSPSVATKSASRNTKIASPDDKPSLKIAGLLPPKKSPASKISNMSDFVGKTKNLTIQTRDEKSVVSSMSKTQSMSPTANASQNITSPRSQPLILSPKNPSPGPITISSVFTLGETASRDLKDFVATFQPFAEKTTEGQKLRAEGFKMSDPDDKGYCTLENISSFIRQSLELSISSASRSDKIFNFFQPSYALAFAKAKELDRSGNNENNLSFAEFRVFNADLCIYAAMYDAFCKFQSEDMEQPDDVHERVTLDEFVNQYEKVLGYGFVGLDNIRTEDAARAIFDIIDTNATGVVTLTSWAEYLVKAEIRMKTDVGNLLSGKLQLQVLDENRTVHSNITGVTSPKNGSSTQKILNMSFLK